MSCDCHLEVKNDEQRRVLHTLLAINATMFVVELVGGVLVESSGVLADSLDMLADALVYGISLAAIGRGAALKVRAARWSGACQLLLAGGIVFDVIRRGWYGSEPLSLGMLVLSTVALAANAYCLRLLSRHRDGEVHLRATWIFTRSDVIANVGVILAAVLVAGTGSRWPDLIVGAAIGCVVIHGGLSILAEARAATEPETAVQAHVTDSRTD